MDDVKFTSILELTSKLSLDGTEEIQVSHSEKINLLSILHKYGKAELLTFDTTDTSLTLKDNTVNWFNSVNAAGKTNITLNVPTITTRLPIRACIIMRVKLGHQIKLDVQNIKVSNPDDKDPIIKHDGQGYLTLLGSGLYILEIDDVPRTPYPYHITHITCNYIPPHNVIRYKTSNNNRIYFSTQNEEAWKGVFGYSSEIAHRYNEYLNIGEIETPDIIYTIPSQAFSCQETDVNNYTPTTQFLTEIWLPHTVYSVMAGAFVGCNYLRKFHGGVPGLVSEDGTQILNTYWNGNVELMAIAPGSCGHPLSLHFQGENDKETFIFYVDERATSIGELVFAYMPETIPIRTLVFGHNVKTVAGTSFFMNQCIDTLILGDRFLSFNPGALIGGAYNNIPYRLSRVFCSNHQPHILYRSLADDMPTVEYSLMSMMASRLGGRIMEAIPNSIVTSHEGGFMTGAYNMLYPLDNEIIYSTYDDTPIIGDYVEQVGILNFYDGDPNEATWDINPVPSKDIKADNEVLIGGIFTGKELSQIQVISGNESATNFRGVIDNSHGFDMYVGRPMDSRFNFWVTNELPEGHHTFGVAGNIRSLRFPRSVKGICQASITIGAMDGPLDIYFYSPSAVTVMPNSDVSVITGASYSDKPVIIHVVKGLKNDYLESWRHTIDNFPGEISIVDDINVY